MSQVSTMERHTRMKLKQLERALLQAGAAAEAAKNDGRFRNGQGTLDALLGRIKETLSDVITVRREWGGGAMLGGEDKPAPKAIEPQKEAR